MIAHAYMNSLKKTYLSSVAQFALAALIGTAVLAAPRAASARNFDVANAGALQNAINDAQNGDTITFTSNVTLSSNLPNITKNVTINGNGKTLSGNNQYRGLFVQSGTVAVSNLTISNAKAQGGNGGGAFGNLGGKSRSNNQGGAGGGGGGLGGALFVAKGANVTVNNVNLTSNSARGGNGGSASVYDSLFQLGTSGGGGSMFGNGQSGGTTLDGGGGEDHGAPGFGGGGGGGGTGGFGGGGGGAKSTPAGAGGFGGGGGARSVGGVGGKGGFGGGDGGTGKFNRGGGGAGMGGAIFVQQGGALNLAGPLTISGNAVAGGGGNQNGQAYGSGVFLQGNGYLLFTPGAGQTQTVSDAIADETGVAGSGGIWGLMKNGAGTTILTGANAYSGTAIVNAGVLEGSTVSLTGSGIEDNASVIFNQAGNGTYAGVISGSGGLTKIGAGTLTLSNNGNIYAGGTTISQGLIAFGSANNLGTGKITLNGGGLQWTRGNTIDISSRLNPIGAAGGTFDTNGNTVTLGSILSGPGGVVKAGGGDLILSGTNTYSGGTSVTGGVLRFTNDANLGEAGTGVTLNSGGEVGTTTDTPAAASDSRPITLAGNGGGINVALHPFTWSGPISGPGAFIKTGPGELELTGTNTYSGGTKLMGGTLRIASDAELGAPGTAITMAGGALRASASFTSPRNVDVLRLGGSFLVDSGQTLTLSGVISGDQNITKVGAGTLVLTGANTFTGNFFNNGGVLQGNAANLGGNIFFDSNAGNTIARSVVFNQAGNGTYAGNITGLGSLTKTGAGVLTLSGTNSYSQGTTVAAGTLQGTTASLQGNIVNNAAVVFDQATDGTYAGSMKGPGTLTKNGTGTVKLAGTSSVGGGTALNAGGLWVDGNLTSDVSVNGGVLRGTGNIDGNVVENGGTVEPGDIGVLTINGDYTIDRGTYETEITPSDIPGVGDDELVVHGITKLAGNLRVLVDPANNYTLGEPYDILHATDGVSGSFATVATDPYFAGYLDPVVTYEPSDVLFRLNPTEKLFQSGQQAADMQTAILGAAAGVADTVLADGCGASAEGHKAPENDCVIRPLGNGIHSEVWLRGLGGIGNLYGSGTRSSFTDNYGGMLIGYGVDFGHFTVGLGAGYLATGLNFADGSNATENTGIGLAYARYSVSRFHINAVAAYGAGTVDGKRAIPGTIFTAESSRSGNFGLFAVRAAYDLPLGAYTLEPRAGFAYAHAHQSDFTESGASLLDLGYGGLNTNETTGRVTLRLKRSFTLAGWRLAPWIEGGVQETFSGLSRTANVTAYPFSETVAGVSASPTAGIAGLGIQLAAGKNLDGFIRYQGLFAGNETASTFSAGIRYRF